MSLFLPFVTPNLLVLFFPLPLSLLLTPCQSEGRQQVFCDSKIRESQRDGAPLSQADCVGGGEKTYASIFRVCLLHCKRRECLSHPRTTVAPVQHQCVGLISMLQICSCEWGAFLLRGMWATCCWVELPLGRKAVWTNMENEEEKRSKARETESVFHQGHSVHDICRFNTTTHYDFALIISNMFLR